MEQLLFVLFVLFSIGSAVLDRRKRSKRLAEQKARRSRIPGEQAAPPEVMDSGEGQQRPRHPDPLAGPLVYEEDGTNAQEDVGAQTGHADQRPPFQRDPLAEEPPTLYSEGPVEFMEQQALRLERAALKAERKALGQERQALEDARRKLKSQRQTAARQDAARVPHPRSPASTPLQVGALLLDPDKAREAIILAEIIGRPRALRLHDVGGFTQ